MVKKPIDYSKCMFYRLVCRDPTVTECYIGHTTSEVDRRAKHKSDCTNEKSKKYNFFVYRFIRSMGGWDNWELIVHEKRAVEDVIAARLRERHWVEFYKATLNKQVPSRTPKEYDAQYNADHRVERAAYYVENREKRIQQMAAYYSANVAHKKEKHDCLCGGKFTTASKCRHLKTSRHVAYQATL